MLRTLCWASTSTIWNGSWRKCSRHCRYSSTEQELLVRRCRNDSAARRRVCSGPVCLNKFIFLPTFTNTTRFHFNVSCAHRFELTPSWTTQVGHTETCENSLGAQSDPDSRDSRVCLEESESRMCVAHRPAGSSATVSGSMSTEVRRGNDAHPGM